MSSFGGFGNISRFLQLSCLGTIAWQQGIFSSNFHFSPSVSYALTAIESLAWKIWPLSEAVKNEGEAPGQQIIV